MDSEVVVGVEDGSEDSGVNGVEGMLVDLGQVSSDTQGYASWGIPDSGIYRQWIW